MSATITTTNATPSSNGLAANPAAEATNGSHPNEAVLQTLETAAYADDSKTFHFALLDLDKTVFTADDYVRLIHLCFPAGFHMLARKLSEEALAKFPDNPVTIKYARVLAPPRILPDKPVMPADFEANRQWMKENGSQYWGQWVAIKDGKLVGAAETPKQLKEQLGDLKQFFVAIAH